MPMEIKCLPQDIGTVGTIPNIETKNTTIFMIQPEDNTTLITNGIRSTAGDLKSQVAKLVHHLILILTFKGHIITMMILEQIKITGLKWQEDHGVGNQNNQK